MQSNDRVVRIKSDILQWNIAQLKNLCNVQHLQSFNDSIFSESFQVLSNVSKARQWLFLKLVHVTDIFLILNFWANYIFKILFLSFFVEKLVF